MESGEMSAIIPDSAVLHPDYSDAARTRSRKLEHSSDLAMAEERSTELFRLMGRFKVL
jgi:hypothetical protein